MIDPQRGCHIDYPISWDIDAFYRSFGLELKLSYIVPCRDILKSPRVGLKYPDSITIEYIGIRKKTPSDKYTLFRCIQEPFSRYFVQGDTRYILLIPEISLYPTIIHIEIDPTIDTYIKYTWYNLREESRLLRKSIDSWLVSLYLILARIEEVDIAIKRLESKSIFPSSWLSSDIDIGKFISSRYEDMILCSEEICRSIFS